MGGTCQYFIVLYVVSSFEKIWCSSVVWNVKSQYFYILGDPGHMNDIDCKLFLLKWCGLRDLLKDVSHDLTYVIIFEIF